MNTSPDDRVLDTLGKRGSAGELLLLASEQGLDHAYSFPPRAIVDSGHVKVNRASVDASRVPCYRRAMVEAPIRRQTVACAALAVPHTPAMVCQVNQLRRTSSRIRMAARNAGCTLLYSVKANALPGVLTALAPFIDGCGVSSLHEARAARLALGDSGRLHLCAVAVPPPRRRGTGGHLRLRDLQLAHPVGKVGPRLLGKLLNRSARESRTLIPRRPSVRPLHAAHQAGRLAG